MNVFIDYQKAFYTINHSILLCKLEVYGIRGYPLEIIRSYSIGRQQIVKYNECLPVGRVISCGIPQGTLLGPILFLACINDLPNFSDSCHSVLFADDTTLSLTNHYLTSLIISTNIKVDKFITWSKSNRLSVSPD